MTADQLRAKFNAAYKIILREMDRLLEILTEFKDELKARLAVEYEQPTLLDVPRRTEYR